MVHRPPLSSDPLDETDVPQPWTIRPYKPGDERALVELFQEVFHHPMSEDHWRWKLKRLPTPVENVGLAVSGDDRPIFQIAGIPCRFQLNGAARTVMVAVDAMTAPPFRRRGLLTQVGRRLFNLWREAGVSLVIGLPNEAWGSRTAALGWMPLFPLKWLVRPLLPENLLARRLGISGLARLRLLGHLWNAVWDRPQRRGAALRFREPREAGPEIDLLWRNCRDSIATSVVRDRAWLSWRYLAAPHRRYHLLLAEREGQPVGYAVYCVEERSGRRFGFIPEILAARRDREALDALVSETAARLHAAGADWAATLAVPNTRLYRAFRRAGFLFSWGAFRVECVPLDVSLSLTGLRDLKAWQLVGGDFDVI